MTTIHPGIFRGQALWADSVSPRMNTIASRNQFKPIRIGENLVVNYNGLIVAPWKFHVLKSSIFALETSLLGQIFVLRSTLLFK